MSLSLAFVAPVHSAEERPVSDLIWEAMKGRNVILEMSDGSVVQGKLLGVSEDEAAVLDSNGRAVTLLKRSIISVTGAHDYSRNAFSQVHFDGCRRRRR